MHSFMPLTLRSLSILIKEEMTIVGDIKYIRLDEEFLLTECPWADEVEINSLKTYESYPLSAHDIADIVNFKSARSLQQEEVKQVSL